MVTLVAQDHDEAFDVVPEEEKVLLAAIAQTDRGVRSSPGRSCASGCAASGRLLRRIQGPSRALPLIVDIAWRGSGIIGVGRIQWQI